MVPWQALAGQQGLFRAEGRGAAFQHHAGQEAVEVLVVPRGDGIARGADIKVVHSEVFGPEVAVEDGCKQKVASQRSRRDFWCISSWL